MGSFSRSGQQADKCTNPPLDKIRNPNPTGGVIGIDFAGPLIGLSQKGFSLLSLRRVFAAPSEPEGGSSEQIS
jgi:hypothetical protein